VSGYPERWRAVLVSSTGLAEGLLDPTAAAVADALANDGDVVLLVADSSGGRPTRSARRGVEIARVPVPANESVLRRTAAVAAVAAAGAVLPRADVVVALGNDSVTQGAALLLAASLRRPLVLIEYEVEESMRCDESLRQAARKRASLVVDADTGASTRVEAAGPATEEFVHGAGSPEASFTVLHYGYIGPRQDVASLVRAMTLLRDMDGAHVVIAGSGPLASDVHELVERLEVDRVELLPFQPQRQAAALLQRASVHFFGLKDASADLVSHRLRRAAETRRPIIAAVPADSAPASFARSTGVGVVVPPIRPADVAFALREQYDRWRQEGPALAPRREGAPHEAVQQWARAVVQVVEGCWSTAVVPA
jgi:hypothetical protein